MYPFDGDEANAPLGNAIAVGANETNPNTYLTIENNRNYADVEGGFRHHIQAEWNHWWRFKPYESAEDSAHVALLTDRGELDVTISLNEVQSCNAGGSGFCCDDFDEVTNQWGSTVASDNRLVRCSGYDGDNITISNDNVTLGDDEYGCD